MNRIYSVSLLIASLIGFFAAASLPAAVTFNQATLGSTSLTGLDGNTYGTTVTGGAYNQGAVYKLTPPTATQPTGSYRVLHSFGAGLDGKFPTNVIQGTDGFLYGTTYFGGTTANLGVIYRLSPDTGAIVILHRFGSLPNDGTNPAVGMIQGTDGNLYGTTSAGGTAHQGTIFKITLVAGHAVAYATLHSFGDGTVAKEGYGTSVLLGQFADGLIYGESLSGGTYGYGTMFTYKPPATPTVAFAASKPLPPPITIIAQTKPVLQETIIEVEKTMIKNISTTSIQLSQLNGLEKSLESLDKTALSLPPGSLVNTSSLQSGLSPYYALPILSSPADLEKAIRAFQSTLIPDSTQDLIKLQKLMQDWTLQVQLQSNVIKSMGDALKNTVSNLR